MKFAALLLAANAIVIHQNVEQANKQKWGFLKNIVNIDRFFSAGGPPPPRPAEPAAAEPAAEPAPEPEAAAAPEPTTPAPEAPAAEPAAAAPAPAPAAANGTFAQKHKKYHRH